MLKNWNYENYTKFFVPIILALVALLQGWVETGGLERAEVNTVIFLLATALLVFLAPNQKISKEDGTSIPADPNRSQTLLRKHAQTEAHEPEVASEKPTTSTRRRSPKE
jgi:hypothetical protein